MTTEQIASLSVHPLNKEIYGDETADPELVDSIRQHGVLHPISINTAGQILNGTRRWLAAQEAGLTEIETILVTGTDLEQHTFLIESNRQRKKTTGQLANEAHELLRIETELAAQRSKVGKKLAPGKSGSKGRARDVVGEKLGVSGVQVAKAVEIVKSAKSGDPVAKEQMALLEKDRTTISRAHRAVKKSKNKRQSKTNHAKKEAKELERFLRKKHFTALVWPTRDRDKFTVQLRDLVAAKVKALAKR